MESQSSYEGPPSLLTKEKRNCKWWRSFDTHVVEHLLEVCNYIYNGPLISCWAWLQRFGYTQHGVLGLKFISFLPRIFIEHFFKRAWQKEKGSKLKVACLTYEARIIDSKVGNGCIMCGNMPSRKCCTSLPL